MHPPPQKILVTGSAGFIGFHLARRLLDEGCQVVGLDNFNDYYCVQLKRDRHAQLEVHPGYRGHEMDLCDLPRLRQLFADFQPECVLHLAAQPGVRYSLVNPQAYQRSNLEGFLNMLECCRHAQPQPRLIYASSSSVYGSSKKMPFTEDQQVDAPLSLYAATKKANELMAHSYSHLFGLQTIGLRFFTVYGPWGRPDMAVWSFAETLLRGDPIQVYNHGDMYRDFTYIDDIVAGVIGCVRSTNLPRCEIFNIGNHRSERLLDLIHLIASELGIAEPKMEFRPMQDGDVFATYASVEKLHAAVGYEPTTPITVGIPKFVAWLKEYRRIGKCT
ncbi:MAG: NAD-dependent epimerase/dehydratase family protein [Kiritimatiellia bacterium]